MCIRDRYISRVVSNTFKPLFKQVKSFHAKSKFYKNYNLFWVIENSQPLIDKLDVINTRKKAKEVSTFDFGTLYTNLPHDDLLGDFDYSGWYKEQSTTANKEGNG